MLSGRASQVLPRAPHSFLDSDLALDSRQDILDKVRCISGIRRLDKAVVRWGCCIQLLHLFFFFFCWVPVACTLALLEGVLACWTGWRKVEKGFSNTLDMLGERFLKSQPRVCV